MSKCYFTFSAGARQNGIKEIHFENHNRFNPHLVRESHFPSNTRIPFTSHLSSHLLSASNHIFKKDSDQIRTSPANEAPLWKKDFHLQRKRVHFNRNRFNNSRSPSLDQVKNSFRVSKEFTSHFQIRTDENQEKVENPLNNSSSNNKYNSSSPSLFNSVECSNLKKREGIINDSQEFNIEEFIRSQSKQKDSQNEGQLSKNVGRKKKLFDVKKQKSQLGNHHKPLFKTIELNKTLNNTTYNSNTSNRLDYKTSRSKLHYDKWEDAPPAEIGKSSRQETTTTDLPSLSPQTQNTTHNSRTFDKVIPENPHKIPSTNHQKIEEKDKTNIQKEERVHDNFLNEILSDSNNLSRSLSGNNSSNGGISLNKAQELINQNPSLAKKTLLKQKIELSTEELEFIEKGPIQSDSFQLFFKNSLGNKRLDEHIFRKSHMKVKFLKDFSNTSEKLNSSFYSIYSASWKKVYSDEVLNKGIDYINIRMEKEEESHTLIITKKLAKFLFRMN